MTRDSSEKRNISGSNRWKDAQPHSGYEKYKSKLYQDTNFTYQFGTYNTVDEGLGDQALSDVLDRSASCYNL